MDFMNNNAPDKLDSRLSYLFHLISARFFQIGNRHFRHFGLNHYSARMMVMLLDNGEMKTGDLVARMALPQSTISTQLQVLHKRKLITRKRSEQDNRSVMVFLTKEGHDLAVDCNRLSQTVQNYLISHFEQEELEQNVHFLEKINGLLAELENQNLYQFRNIEKETGKPA
ncbi:MAG: winged helix-turn-helix transcriptional regulator [Alcaligenaceae bacterium]|nr:winged helix-turn-helix transcriptional regulator [Alcaligenaceae bacterium]